MSKARQASTATIDIRCMDLRTEIRRISNVTLRQDFRKPEDRKYWEDRLTKLNGELRSLESMEKQP